MLRIITYGEPILEVQIATNLFNLKIVSYYLKNLGLLAIMYNTISCAVTTLILYIYFIVIMHIL
jgi:hypothetical protein